MPKILLITGLFLLAIAAQAALPDSTGVYNMRASRIGINTFSLRNNLIGADSLTGKQLLRYYLFQDWLYNTALTDQRFTREDYLANITHHWNFKPRWSLEQQIFYQNNRSSNTAVSSYSGHIHFRPVMAAGWKLHTDAFAGLKRDARTQRADTGPEYGGNLSASWVSPDQNESAGSNIFFSQARLSPRLFQRVITDVRYEQKFNAFSALAIRGEYRSNRTEDYLVNNVQRIQSDTLATYVTGSYTLSDRFSFRTANQLALPARAFSYRSVSENTASPADSRYTQYELETLQELQYQHEKLQATAQFGYKERNRNYTNEQDNLKDNLQSTTMWGTDATFLFLKNHSISSKSRGELLRVNTPSDLNNEDRDEVYYESRLFISSRWLPTFRTVVGLVGSYKQYVFIKAAQSAENFTERSLFYEPGFVWNPGRFSWDGQMQIQANYQVRALPAEQLRNRANRTFNQTHIFRYEASGNLLYQLDYNRRENRLGLLNWEKFSESPLDTTISNTLVFSIKKILRTKKGQHGFKAGYRFFEQRIQAKAGILEAGQPTTQIYLHTITRQHGPEFGYERKVAGGLRLQSSFWLQQLSNFRKYSKASLPFLGTPLTPAELNLKSSQLYPYFDISVHLPVGFSGRRK